MNRSHPSTAIGTPVNTYACATSCTASYTGTATQTTVVGCCTTGDNCFASGTAAPWTGFKTCYLGSGTATFTVTCTGGNCQVK